MKMSNLDWVRLEDKNRLENKLNLGGTIAVRRRRTKEQQAELDKQNEEQYKKAFADPNLPF